MNYYAVNAGAQSLDPEPDHARESTALIAETSREVERLNFELSSVLARPGSETDWREAKAHSTFSWSGQIGHRSIVDTHMEDEFGDEGVVPANTKAWLNKARRNRRREAVKRALAWILTIGIGSLIIAFTAFLLTGKLPDSSWLFTIVTSRFL